MEYQLLVFRWQDKMVSALYDERRPVQIQADPAFEESADFRAIRMGGIYLCKVKNIVPNINAAFVEIKEGVMGYLSLETKGSPVTLHTHADGKVHVGDELIVQLEREEIKTKPPAVTIHFNLTGKYAVLVHGKDELGISAKIENPHRRKELRDFFSEYATKSYNFIVRTNAEHATAQELTDEIARLRERYQRIITQGICRTRFSTLEEPLPAYLCSIRDNYAEKLKEIITDDPAIFSEIQAYLEEFQPEDAAKLRLYQSELSLVRLFSFESRLKEALGKKVWLKSGASLIIEPTEALTVIDVNSGKAVKDRKKGEEHFLAINLEAAKEIAYQLRLRNLSGIIIVDFIDMKSEQSRERLLYELREFLKKDPVKTTLVGMTPLNLVELTRKKTRKPLHEQFSVEMNDWKR